MAPYLGLTDIISFEMVSAFILLIPVGIWVVLIISWMIDGTIDGLSGTIGLGTMFVALGAAFYLQNATLNIGLAVLMGITVLSMPFIRSGYAKKQSDDLEVEQMQRAYQQLGPNRDNFGARWRIATTLYNNGYPGPALALATQTLDMVPASGFQDERATLKRWKQSVSSTELEQPLTCLACKAQNPAGELYCTKCGQPIMLLVVQTKLEQSGQFQRFAAIWLSALLLLVVIPVIWNFGLGGLVASILSGVVVAFGAFLLYWVFRDR
ncbi:MAG: hypothetical protein ACK4P3_08330 [Fimbriimonadaceae bacterium]